MPPGELHLGLESATRLRVVIDHVVDQHADADLAVLTGDLAKGGAERLILLGTHEPDRVGGLLCGHRLAWLRRRLIDVPNQPVTLYMHHLPMCFGVAHFESICLAEPEPFFEFLRDHLSRVRRVVFGHINLPLSGVLEGGIPFWAGRRCNHQLILALDDLQPTGLSPAPTTASSDWRRLTPVSMPSISSAFSRSAEPALAPVFDPDIQPFPSNRDRLAGRAARFGLKVGPTTLKIFEGRILEMVDGNNNKPEVAEAFRSTRATLMPEFRSLERRLPAPVQRDVWARLPTHSAEQ